MGSVSRVSDGELARLAGRHRVLTHRQLRTAGLSGEAIAYRVAQGRLQPQCRGVYVVGPAAPPPLTLAVVAVAATGGNGFLSHRWGAYGWSFGPLPELPVDVTVVRGSRRGRPDKVRVHRSRILERRDMTTRHGIPILSPARILLDLAATATAYELERLVADAQVAGVVAEEQIAELLRRAGRHPGAVRLGAIVAERPGLTRAESERILRRLLRAAGLPQPEADAPLLGRYRADFLFRAHRLVLEVDGFGTHGHRQAFEHDRRRNAALTAAGFSVMQITWRQLHDEPVAVVARIAAALARRAPDRS